MRALIVCNGEPPDNHIFNRYAGPDCIVIAADGGAATLQRMNIRPHAIVGDMDSFDQKFAEGVPVFHDPDQETNDLEKALAYCLSQGAAEAIIFGATGLRTDQTLKNLSVLKQFSPKFSGLRIVDEYCEIFLSPGSIELERKPGTGISLFPLSGRVDGIVTKGLEYPLNNETLENGVRDGSSNRFTSPNASISHKKGDLLILIAHEEKEV